MQRILFLLGLSLFSVSFFIGDVLAQDVQLLSPSIAFTAEEVFFRNPVTYLGLDGKPHKARSAIKLLLRGEGFQEHATGPRFFLGERLADAHYTSPDGKMVAVYFHDPVRIPLRALVRIETTTDRVVTLNQPFELDKVRWLSPQIRKRHSLPDLRERLLLKEKYVPQEGAREAEEQTKQNQQ